MNGYTEWGQIASENKSKNADMIPFLWLKSGKTYRVRPIHKPVQFYKYFNKIDGKIRTAICNDPKTCEVKRAHPDLIANERYAILVIDRADQAIKIMEGPKTVFVAMKEWWETTQKNPGGNDGVDWAIKITGAGVKGTKYSVTAIEPVPFTGAEKESIYAILKDENGNDTDFLANKFRPDKPEVIEQKLFSEAEDNSTENSTVEENDNTEIETKASAVDSSVDW